MVMNAYRKEQLRSITRSWSRFLAIAAIVALGAGFLSGLTATSPDMRRRADSYYDAKNMMDIRVLSTMGLTEGDVTALRAVEGVEAAEPSQYVDREVQIGDNTFLIRIHALPQAINTLVLDEGRMPGEGECVLNPGKLNVDSVHIGDTMRIESEELELAETEFTIVGFVRDPQYLSFSFGSTNMGNGSLNYAIYVQKDTFTTDYYTEIRLLVTDAVKLNSFSAAYTEAVDTVKSRIEVIQQTREEARYNEIRGEAETEIADAWAQYDAKEKEAEEALDEAAEALASGWDEVRGKEQELSDGKQQYEEALAELEDQKAQAEATFRTTQGELDQAEMRLSTSRKELENGAFELRSKKAELDAAEQTLNETKQALDEANETLSAKREELNLAKAALEEKKQELDEAEEGLLTLNAAIESIDSQLEALQNEQNPAEGTDLYDRLIEQRVQLDQQYQFAQNAVQEGRTSYQNGLDAYQSGETAYLGAEEEFERGMDQYESGYTEFQTGLQAYRQAASQIDDGWAQYNAGVSQLEEGKIRLASAKEEAERQFADAEQKLIETAETLADGEKTIDEAKAELADGEQEYENQKAEAEEQLAEARKEIEEAEAELSALEHPEWYVLTREQNEGYVSYKNDAERMRSIATVFPWMFFFVAALVSLTSMTRMVEEDRVMIGTFKALGFSKGKILAKYVMYAVLASILGGLTGVALLMKVLPYVVCKAYDTMYIVRQPIRTPYYASYSLISIGLSIVCTVGATLFAGYRTMSAVPASLMMPQAPKAGKRILLERVPFLWKKLRFTHKVTARNLFRYKKRLFMTIIGISGCTALLLTGFGLYDSVSGILEKQYGEIYRYRVMAGYEMSEDETAEEAVKNLHEALDPSLDADSFMLQMTKRVELSTVSSKGKIRTADVYVYVPEQTEGFDKFVALRTRNDGHPIELTDDRVVITEKLSERLGLSVGDTFYLKNEAGRSIPFTVTDITEHYVRDYVYLSRARYEAQMQETWVPSEVDSLSNDEEILARLRNDVEGITTISNTEDVTRTFEKMLDSLNMVIAVLILSAGVLAYIVLYNLTNINVMERKREIATIKVLGFYHNEVNAYIYRETTLLTLIGCLLGLLFGVVLHRFVITTVEVDAVMFSRTIHFRSFVYSMLLTGVFSGIVNAVMYRKLKQISMVESLKSVE